MNRISPAPRWVAGVIVAALPAFGLATAAASLADDDFDCMASISLDCMMDFGDSTGPSGFGGDNGFQPGNLVIPADGGPPQVAAAPGPLGGPVVTAGGGLVIPGAPPIG